MKEVGITIATHGWIGSDMSRGKFMLEDGAEMQWKEEREVSLFLGLPTFSLLLFFLGLENLGKIKEKQGNATPAKIMS